ncbi:MAG: hypothetical protein P4N59_13545 [Negativicutes bacterium]|nr:hypothetical protein [Negativicutes bacterium]
MKKAKSQSILTYRDEWSFIMQNIAIPKKMIGPAITVAMPIEAPTIRKNGHADPLWIMPNQGVSIKTAAMPSNTITHEHIKKT